MKTIIVAHDRSQGLTVVLRSFDDAAEAAVCVSDLEDRFAEHPDVDVEAYLFDTVAEFLQTFPRYARGPGVV